MTRAEFERVLSELELAVVRFVADPYTDRGTLNFSCARVEVARAAVLAAFDAKGEGGSHG